MVKGFANHLHNLVARFHAIRIGGDSDNAVFTSLQEFAGVKRLAIHLTHKRINRPLLIHGKLRVNVLGQLLRHRGSIWSCGNQLSFLRGHLISVGHIHGCVSGFHLGRLKVHVWNLHDAGVHILGQIALAKRDGVHLHGVLGRAVGRHAPRHKNHADDLNGITQWIQAPQSHA